MFSWFRKIKTKKLIEKEFKKQYIDTGIAKDVHIYWDKSQNSFAVTYTPIQVKSIDDIEEIIVEEINE